MTLSRNDWSRWIKGLVGAAISGTSAAISSGVSVSLIAPDKFNLSSELGNMIKMVLVTAGVAFVVSVSKYLKDHPMPDDLPE